MSDRAPDAPAEQADTLTAPRRERMIVIVSAATAAAAWPGGVALLAAENAGLLTLAPLTFGLLASWIIGLGCLGLGIGLLRPRDPLHAWERGLRALPGHGHVRQLLSHSASASWALALAYTVIAARHAFNVALIVNVFTLIFCLAWAVWTTVIVIVAPSKTRLETAYVLTRAAHEQLLADRERAEAAAGHVADIAMQESDEAAARARGPEQMRSQWRVHDGGAAEPAPAPGHGQNAAGQ